MGGWVDEKKKERSVEKESLPTHPPTHPLLTEAEGSSRKSKRTAENELKAKVFYGDFSKKDLTVFINEGIAGKVKKPTHPPTHPSTIPS